MDTSGIEPSGLGVMISSINTRRLSESDMTSAFSTTLDANLCLDIWNICPRSLEMIRARSSGLPCSNTNWIT